MLGNVPVGADHPTLFMPEICLYFGRDVGAARERIQMVKDAGFDVIKGEVALTAEIVLDDGFIYEYETHHGRRARPYREIIEELVMPMETWTALYRACHDLGLATVVSAYDKAAVDFLVDVGAACVKISGNNLVNVALIRHAAKTGLPVMMDSGKANLEEVARAVDVLRQAGCEDFILNHAPDGHPAAPADHHLRIIETYQRAFDCPVGLADHHTGDEIMYAAVGMGYSLLEKPVVPEPEEVDVDAPWTMRLSDMAAVRRKVQACWEARGQTRRPVHYTDKDHAARMGVVTARAVTVGEALDETSARFAWPLRGISVYHWDLVDGATFTRDMAADQPVQWDDVQLHSKP